VRPDGRREVVTKSGSVSNASVTERLLVRGDAAPGASRIRIRLAPSLASAMLGSLDYLAQYPYGCTEQTTSCFLPDVVIWRALKSLHIDNPNLKRQLPDMVGRGLNRLYDFQHDPVAIRSRRSGIQDGPCKLVQLQFAGVARVLEVQGFFPVRGRVVGRIDGQPNVVFANFQDCHMNIVTDDDPLVLSTGNELHSAPLESGVLRIFTPPRRAFLSNTRFTPASPTERPEKRQCSEIAGRLEPRASILTHAASQSKLE